MKYFIALTILLQTTIFAYSQISVTGIVLDKETRQNLEFALIRISGANKTVSTDKYGGFELRLPGAITTDSSVSLTVSYIGYIGKQSFYSISNVGITSKSIRRDLSTC